MNSSTGLTLTQSHVAPTPLTQFAKNAVKAMAIEQGHTCLKFTNKKGIELGNSDWIAGVDCDNSHKNQNKEESDSNNDSTDNECKPELEQCESEDNSSDNDSHANEDIEEEMDNLFDDNDNNDNDDTSNKDTDDEHNDDDDDDNGDAANFNVRFMMSSLTHDQADCHFESIKKVALIKSDRHFCVKNAFFNNFDVKHT